MIIIDTSNGLLKTPLADPIAANTSPTSPRATIPIPIANRLTFGIPNTTQPVTALPTIATATKKTAINSPALLSATAGFRTLKSALAPTVTKKMGGFLDLPW